MSLSKEEEGTLGSGRLSRDLGKDRSGGGAGVTPFLRGVPNTEKKQ